MRKKQNQHIQGAAKYIVVIVMNTLLVFQITKNKRIRNIQMQLIVIIEVIHRYINVKIKAQS